MAEVQCVLEWTIKNFSCWNSAIHGKFINPPDSPFPFGVLFYPRGRNGFGEHLEVQLSGQSTITSSCDLSFIGSNGYVFCTRNTQVCKGNFEAHIIRGPKFEEVKAQIKKNEDQHKDQFTLQFNQKGTSLRDEYVSTKIECFRSSLKILGTKLDDYLQSDNFMSSNIFPSDDNTMAIIYVFTSKDKPNYSEIKFTFKPPFSPECLKEVLVFANISVINKANAVVRTTEFEHILTKDPWRNWVISCPLNREEVAKNCFSLLLRLKIVPKNKYKHKFGYSYVPNKFNMIPTYSSKPCLNFSVIEEIVCKTLNANTSSQLENPVTDLSKDLMCLYQDQDLSDFQLKCDNVTFPVHKVILSARSPVFKTMLSCDMREAASGEVVIEDLDPSTLSLFLTYLYTGRAVEAKLQSDRALKLYYAADKYEVPSLKRDCSKFLCANVSISNVCDILSSADRHQAQDLLSVAQDFILKNYNDVLCSKEWDDLLKRDPVLVAKSLTQFAQKKQVGKIIGS